MSRGAGPKAGINSFNPRQILKGHRCTDRLISRSALVAARCRGWRHSSPGRSGRESHRSWRVRTHRVGEAKCALARSNYGTEEGSWGS